MKTESSTFAAGALCLLAACTGQIAAQPGTLPGGSGGSGAPAEPGPVGPIVGPGSSGGPGPATGCAQSGAAAAVLHARMLSPSQYNNSVADLFKVQGDPAREFGGGADTQLDDLGAERRATAATSIARQAAASLAMWAPCAPPAVAADACEQQLIDEVGLRAYRHPLSVDEKAELEALFDAGIKEKDFSTGVEWFLTGLLQTPDFLYQFAKPAAGEKDGELRPLGGFEMASRLSYFLWDSMPDDKLFAAAAETNGLGDLAQVGAQIDRMLQDQPRFLRGVTSFYSTWLSIDGFNELAREDKAFTSDLVHALGTSLLKSATLLYASPAPNITALFSGDSYYLNGALRTFYGRGTGAGAADFAATAMPGEGRHGLLTHPALMAQLARPQKTHPINRGLFVRSKLLCQEMAPPPGLDIPALPEMPTAGVTTRAEVSDHAKPACAVCHDLLDPPGFALESFDQVGRHRDSENSRPVDTSGTMRNSGDLDGAFAQGDDLLQKVAGSASVKGCFAQQYVEYALTGDVAHAVAAEDRCTVAAVGKSFSGSGDLRQLVAWIATSDSFRQRRSEGVAP